MPPMDEEDPFWTVALLPQEREACTSHHFEDISECDDISHDDNANAAVRYQIPFSSDVLLVRPISSLDGDMWSPLGAHTWYGAALLSSYLLSPSCNGPLSKLFQGRKPLTALELGSGAVGLAGLSLASRLAQCGATNSHVFFSDNVRSLVGRLQQNVKANEHTYTSHVQCSVLYLDWQEAETWNLPSLDFIFGS
jgi:hypothetical protein